MTDKQIIIYKKECYNEPHCSLNQVLEQLKAKEQECEKLRFPMKDSNYAILTKEEFEEYDQLKFDYAELEKRHNDSFEQFKQLKLENKHLNDLLNQALKELEKTVQTLAEIKEVLQFYNNTTIGVDKGNGVFEIEVSNDNFGKLIYCYDTNPAKEALQKISEVENG